ncbi:MAG: LAGLIDADG family homing endonuclease [Patescibacteria group bacterium]
MFKIRKKKATPEIQSKPAEPEPTQKAQSGKPEIKNPVSAIRDQGVGLIDTIAPKSLEVDFDYLKIDEVYLRTLFVSGYPRFVSPGWLEPIINFDGSLDISFYIYPIEGKGVLDDLRRKVAEMEAEIETDLQRGKIVDPATKAKLEDARSLQEELVKGAEHFFEFAFYITIPAGSLEELNQITKQVRSTLGALLISSSHATLDMVDGFFTTAPFGMDKLSITRNMDTTSLATTFPLTSAELSSDKGILYGINPQNESFIIFDRFSLENANTTIFGTSGGGKSIGYSEPVLYQDNSGKIRLDRISGVVEKTLKERQVKQIDDEIEGVFNPDIKVFAFDSNLGGKWSEVTIAARKLSPKTLYRIHTKSGRRVDITPDHCLVALKNGKIRTIKGEEVEPGNYIPLPRKVEQPPATLNSIDVESILQKSNIKYLKKRNGRVGNRLFSKKTSLPVKIKLGPHFFEILGYFASEGMIIPTRALITTQNRNVIASIKKYYESLGIAYSLVKRKDELIGIYVSAQAFVELLRGLGASGKAHQKRVPQVVFSVSNEMVSSFLRAYFEGDGGVEDHKITATTKSKGLASDLSYLLLRFGIIARIKETKKAATNTKHKKKRLYYRIYISGQDNIRKFVKEIGFISKEKNKKGRALIKKGNTNVDVIPELGSIFEEIYKELYASTEIPAPKNFSEIKLGIFKPSPQTLLEIATGIEKRITEIENLEKDGLLTLKSLPTLREILEEGAKKEKNTLLWNALGESWRTMKKGTPPYLFNTLKAAKITHNVNHSTQSIGRSIYRTFKTTGESLRALDESLWSSVVIRKSNPQYERLIEARDYIAKKYEVKKKKLAKTKERVNWLKTLASSDLFWDPIVKVEKIKSKHKYVYDLQVDNGVFLAGHGGLFVHNSYFVKLESVRSLMLGSEVIIIDPESEYKTLSDAVGGQFISFSFSSPSKINPFDLSQVYEPGENQLGLKILSLHSLFKIIMGELTATQEALLDRALIATYRGKGITFDPETQKKEPPLMEDLYKILIGMETEDALDLAARIEKFVKGSFVGIFDQQTNINIDNPFTVFSVRELQDVLRPIAMFIILDFIWTRVKKDLKKRLLLVDEAWHMMRYPDSAQFLWSIVKRARKYYLGLTTITQDVEDFLAQDIGKAIVTNSALRVLFKQSPAAIDRVGEVFYLSQGEKQLLLAANVGEGIFFAGNSHAPIYVVASPEEHKLVTTKPSELLEIKGQTPAGAAKMAETRVEGSRR